MLKVVVLYLLSLLFTAGGVGQCYGQVLDDGFWPLPVGVFFILLGGFLWHLGARARLRLSGSGEAA
ncbi:MAG: hypothetical protein ABL998_08140 [Planctomycetota bacterium]